MRLVALLCLTTLAAAVPVRAQDALVEAAEAWLGARFPAHAHRLEVRLVREGGSRPGDGWRLRFHDEATLPRGHVQADVVDAGGEKAGWVRLYVAHFDSVAVAATTVRKDEPVPDDAIGFAWTEITRFAGEPLTPSALATLRRADPGAALWAARPVRADRPLRVGDLRLPWAADTGDAVRMTYARGSVRLTLSTQAREPGMIGDEIRLYAPDARATYRARLTGRRTATWLETL